MAKLGKLARFGVFVVVAVIAWLAVEYFDVPDIIVIWVLLIAAYLQHDTMLEKLSMDLQMVEGFLDERFPEEFGGDKELRRKF